MMFDEDDKKNWRSKKFVDRLEQKLITASL